MAGEDLSIDDNSFVLYTDRQDLTRPAAYTGDKLQLVDSQNSPDCLIASYNIPLAHFNGVVCMARRLH